MVMELQKVQTFRFSLRTLHHLKEQCQNLGTAPFSFLFRDSRTSPWGKKPSCFCATCRLSNSQFPACMLRYATFGCWSSTRERYQPLICHFHKDTFQHNSQNTKIFLLKLNKPRREFVLLDAANTRDVCFFKTDDDEKFGGIELHCFTLTSELVTLK